MVKHSSEFLKLKLGLFLVGDHGDIQNFQLQHKEGGEKDMWEIQECVSLNVNLD